MEIPSYSKPVALAKHRNTDRLTEGPGSIYVQEKVDGSQMSFKVTTEGKVHFRSKGNALELDNLQALFRPAVENILDHAHLLELGTIYRGEAFRGPKHNKLEYQRCPKGNFVLFDAEDCFTGSHYQGETLQELADKLEVECTPLLGKVEIGSGDEVGQIKRIFEQHRAKGSFLGGTLEGVVAKNYDQKDHDGKVIMCKIVSDEFKEVAKVKGGGQKAVKREIVGDIGLQLRTEARWQKAFQHLRDAGELTGSMKDVGPLIKELQRDVWEEEEAWVKEELLKAFKKDIERVFVKGFPEWYKTALDTDAV